MSFGPCPSVLSFGPFTLAVRRAGGLLCMSFWLCPSGSTRGSPVLASLDLENHVWSVERNPESIEHVATK